MELNKTYVGDCLELSKILEPSSIDCIITSPPYWNLRDYGIDGQIGRETKSEEYIDKLITLFDNLKPALKNCGTLFVNLGDSYGGSGSKLNSNSDNKGNINAVLGQQKSLSVGYMNKCLLQLPAKFSIKMVEHGWILRNEIIWHKPNAMPSSVKDRFTVDFEKIFFFVKKEKYWFNQIKEPMLTKDISSPRGSKGTLGKLNKGRRLKQDNIGRNDYIGFNSRYIPNEDLMRNKRCVWSISTESSSIDHCAMFPKKLVENMVESGCPKNGVILDPFMGSGTTGKVANEHNRNYVGFEINPEYAELSKKRLDDVCYQYDIFEDNQDEND